MIGDHLLLPLLTVGKIGIDDDDDDDDGPYIIFLIF